jgi:hypothetical protein
MLEEQRNRLGRPRSGLQRHRHGQPDRQLLQCHLPGYSTIDEDCADTRVDTNNVAAINNTVNNCNYY